MSGKPFVPVVGSDGRPLMPCTGKRARLLLERGRARVYRRMPFTLQLKDRSQDDCDLQPLQLKIDPGSRGTGLAVARVDPAGALVVVHLYEVEHRGLKIRDKLRSRAMLRRGRRQRKTRYRLARFDNRTKPEGWLPPSLMHRVHTTMTWVKRLQAQYPISMIGVESVKFDMHKLRHPEIYGVEYQHGELYKSEIKEYLLEKWGRKCAYCDETKVSRFEVDHGTPRSRGGADSVGNFVLSCHTCNHDRKKNQTVQEFLAHDPVRRDHILRMLKAPLNDAAAVNTTRNRLIAELETTNLPIFSGTGAQTKYNRITHGVPKSHALDALCIGTVRAVKHWNRPTQVVKAIGHGTYQRTLPDKYGFPRLQRARSKTAFGFTTGDLVRAMNHRGSHIGRVSVRQNGGFVIHIGYKFETASYRNCQLLQKGDGYQYYQRPASEHSTDRPTPL